MQEALRVLKRIALAAVLIVGVCVQAISVAQDTAPAAAAPDSLTEKIGAEMDRRAAEVAAAPTDTKIPAPVVPSAPRSIAALAFVLALILLVYGAARRWGKRVPILAGAHLGKVLGRLYLDRSTALHFVQVGEKVLLIGANANSVSLIGEFAAGGLNRGNAQAPATAAAIPFNPDSFLAELRARSQDLKPAQHVPQAEEDEIANLRGDIQRLQRYLREENREHED